MRARLENEMKEGRYWEGKMEGGIVYVERRRKHGNMCKRNAESGRREG